MLCMHNLISVFCFIERRTHSKYTYVFFCKYARAKLKEALLQFIYFLFPECSKANDGKYTWMNRKIYRSFAISVVSVATQWSIIISIAPRLSASAFSKTSCIKHITKLLEHIKQILLDVMLRFWSYANGYRYESKDVIWCCLHTHEVEICIKYRVILDIKTFGCVNGCWYIQNDCGRLFILKNI